MTYYSPGSIIYIHYTYNTIGLKYRLYYTPDIIDHDYKTAETDYWKSDVSWEEYIEKYPVNKDKHFVREEIMVGRDKGKHDILTYEDN